MRTIVHLAASPFFGGPERQMLGLAMHLPSDHRSIFFSFAERGLCQPFLDQLQKHNIPAEALHQNTPHILAAAKEVAHHLRDTRADVLCCHGYKADIVGWLAGRRAGVPVVSISRGWTAATRRVRFYEMLDRRVLRWMDRVVCVSEGQATKVRAAGVREDRIMVIRNAIDLDRFSSPDPTYRQKLRELLPSSPARIVCAAGRLSPEKGFPVLVAAAGILRQAAADVGFILFGEGPERPLIEEQIRTLGLDGRFVLAGFRDDVDAFLPHADAVVLPSHTEGLPNVALEALAAGVPVVATAVGGTPEVVQDGVSGYLVPSGDPAALARRIVDVLADENQRIAMGQCGRAHLRQSFGFESQAQQYIRLFNDIVQDRPQTSLKLGKTSPAGVS